MYMNLYVIPAIIASILSAFIGIYVFFKNPKKIQNRVFLLLALFFIAFSFAEVIIRVLNNVDDVLFWGRIGYLGVIVGPIIFLHLSFVFPRETPLSSRKKCFLASMYVIGFLVLIIFNIVISTQDVQLSRWGYRLALKPSLFFIGIWIIIVFLFSVLNLLKSYIQAKHIIERKQVNHIFYGGFVTIVITVLSNVVSPIFGFEMFPMAAVAISIFTIFIGFAILKYNLFRFKPMVEPSVEKMDKRPQLFELRPHKSYAVKEISSNMGYKIFKDQITHGTSGLCVTKYNPEKIRERHGLKTTPIIWFTFKQSKNEKVVVPQKIDIELIPEVEYFIKKGKKTIVYVDCFYDMKLVNGFENSKVFLNDISRLCKEYNSNLLISLDSDIFEEKQVSFFKENFEIIRMGGGS